MSEPLIGLHRERSDKSSWLCVQRESLAGPFWAQLELAQNNVQRNDTFPFLPVPASIVRLIPNSYNEVPPKLSSWILSRASNNLSLHVRLINGVFIINQITLHSSIHIHMRFYVDQNKLFDSLI